MSTLSTPEHPPAQSRGPQAPHGAAEPAPPTTPPAGNARRERALLLVTLVLILSASAAFLRAQTLKLEPSALQRPRVESVFSPVCRCPDKTLANLSFGLRRPSRVDAQMIDSEARLVRTLVSGAQLPAGRAQLTWDGRDDRRRLAPDGAYRLRLLLDEEREVIVPRIVTVDTRAPRVELVSVAPRTLAEPARGRGARARRRARSAPLRGAPVEVRYRASESGRTTLLVDGGPAAATGRREAGARLLRWDGRLDGRSLRRGSHELVVRTRDRAGNLSAPSRGLTVRVGRSRGR